MEQFLSALFNEQGRTSDRKKKEYSDEDMKAKKFTPLHTAIKNRESIQTIKALAQSSPQWINAKDYKGRTPLWHASNLSNYTVLRTLIQQKGDATIKADDGTNCIDSFLGTSRLAGTLMLVKELGHKTVAQYVNLSCPNGNTPLHRAVMNGSPAMMELLIQLGADPKCKDEDGYTLLHVSALTGNIACAQVLIPHLPPSTECYNNAGLTPLMIAAIRGHDKFVEWMLAHGADPALKIQEGKHVGKTALDLNISRSISEILRVASLFRTDQ